MKILRSLSIMLFITFAFSACKDDDFSSQEQASPTVTTFQNVDARLWPFWREFEVQAARRGIDFDLSDWNLVGQIEPIAEENVAGTCSYGGNHPNTVTIDEEIWDELPEIYKEFIIFHELGHCVLFRDHEEASNSGICASIMRSGLTRCRDNYNLNTRDSYLNELFGATP